MKLLPITVFGFAVFLAGIFVAPLAQWIIRTSTGGGEPRCVGAVCVGESAATAFNAYGLSAEAGGLEAVICGKGPGAKYIFWRDYVFAEQRCDGAQRTIIMRSPQYQTNFEIEQGRIAKIIRYPLPQIDP